jgi:hypothetical protein
MQVGSMSTLHAIIFAAVLVAIVGFFPVLDLMTSWRMDKHLRAEQRERMKHARKHWRRSFIWSVFSTKRVPRLTDQRDAGWRQFDQRH